MNGKEKRPILLELDAVHPCWCIESINKVEGAQISLVSPLVSEKDVSCGYYELNAPNVDLFIDTLKKHPWVKEILVIEKTKNHAFALIRSQHDKLMIETMVKTGALPLEPTLTKSGFDTVALIVPDDKTLRVLASALKENFEYKIRFKKYLVKEKKVGGERFGGTGLFSSTDFLKLKLATESLSPKQREAVMLASEKGYWATPKRVDLEELARLAGINKATFSEHLRKAEIKLLPIIADLLKKLVFKNPPASAGARPI